MRAVVDTNILVRALIMPHGSVGPVLLRLPQREYTLLYAQSVLEELTGRSRNARTTHQRLS